MCGKDEANAKWISIAEKLRILYDPKLDFHPQYESFKVGTEIKQADTVLIGYPLMFSMNTSTRINDLKIYADSTRNSGPAMSVSMYAINYLDIDNEEAGNEMLLKSYKPYIRQPFNVWSEVVEDETGATNFITGAGGFLQTIFNGFLGIRLHLNHLEIRNPRRPNSLQTFQVKGFSYLHSMFQISLKSNGIFVAFVSLKDDLVMRLESGEDVFILENISCT